MQLSHLNDESLDSSNIAIARTEREVLSKVLHHLRETDRRRLYSKYKFSSLQEYAMKRMGYTEDQAWRRINAMRLLKDLPQIEEKIESGALNLTHLNQAKSLFAQEKKAQIVRTVDEKLELLAKIERQSRRQAEKTIECESLVSPVLGDAFAANVRRPIELDQFSEEVQKKIKRLLDVRAHAGAHDIRSVIEQALDLAIKKWDPLMRAERAERTSLRTVRHPGIPAPARKITPRMPRSNSNAATIALSAQSLA